MGVLLFHVNEDSVFTLSDNANPNRSSSVTKSIPVQFQIKMAITV